MANKSTGIRSVRLPTTAIAQVEAIAKQTQTPPATLIKGVVLDWLQNHAACSLAEQEQAVFAMRN